MKNIKNPAKSPSSSFAHVRDLISKDVVAAFENFNNARFSEGFDILPGFNTKDTDLYVKQDLENFLSSEQEATSKHTGEVLARVLQKEVFNEIIDNAFTSEPASDMVTALEEARAGLTESVTFMFPAQFSQLIGKLPDEMVWSVNKVRRITLNSKVHAHTIVETTQIRPGFAIVVNQENPPVLKITGPFDSTPAEEAGHSLQHSFQSILSNTDDVRVVAL